MIYDNMDFFNIRELTKMPNYPGLRLNRFPQNIIDKFESPTPASFGRGQEIRFQMENGIIKVYLLPVDDAAEIVVYFGDYFSGRHILPRGIISPVEISVPELLKKDFSKLNEKARFSKNLCRLFINSKSIIHYCGADFGGQSVFPPSKDNIPQKNFLAYGSSITHGAIAVGNNNSYIQILAQLLKADVYNFGMSGCCRLEKDIADFIIEETNCDFYFLELGVNIRAIYDKDEFYKRASYLINGLCKKNIPVYVTTIFPNIHTYVKEEPNYIREQEFNNVLRKIATEINKENVTLIEGSNVLKSFNMLANDLIHPSDAGHREMAYNLFKIIKNNKNLI